MFHIELRMGFVIMAADIIAFPQDRSNRKKENDPSGLDASVSRHPAGKAKPVTPEAPSDDFSFIGVRQILPAGMETTNIKEIDYHINRLDVVMQSVAGRTSSTDMAMLAKYIRQALITTAEITYFEGLAEGYTSYEEEEDPLT